MKSDFSRRELMGGSIAVLASLGVSSAAPKADDDTGFKLGIASYSFRKLSRADAIKGMEALKCRYINIKDFHASMKSTPEELEQIRKDFENAGIKILGVGNISLRKPDEGEIKRAFEYAKTLTAPVIVMAPSVDSLPLIEKHVKEYNIKAAIHNHGPEDKAFFPAPSDVLKAVKGMDERVGLCIDIGHTTRTGANVVESIKMAGKRLHDMHSKDLGDLMNKDSQVAVGEGAMPIPQIFQALMKSGFK
ncbi:MAG: sugar phosphate isomerase/epimerase, partial [Bryobacteraceae bacterium]|nr:sugar phosphate isomerase/epimerase [Bryobacteraceae bacterium]